MSGGLHSDYRTAERLILASASPRRSGLLDELGLVFEIAPPDIDESVLPGELGRPYVERLARGKAAVMAAPGAVVVAADTTVDLDGELLGKPVDAEDARRLIRAIADTTHHVHTGVCVHRITADGEVIIRSAVATTAVTIAPIAEDWIEWYVGTGEPLDKAGAYGMQGPGAMFVAGIVGSPSNVVGLPLDLLARLTGEAGVDLLSFRR
jgi:septum formation protein